MTDHTSMELATLDALRARLEQVEAERDALAAHVDRLRSMRDEYDNTAGTQPGPFIALLLGEMDSFEESPTTSLARRDATKKADGIKEMLDHVEFKDCQHLTVSAGRVWENRFRKQAEDVRHDG